MKNKVIVEKPFPNSGVTGRLWTLGHLDARRQYMLLVLYVSRQVCF